jgi:hypothetical protein
VVDALARHRRDGIGPSACGIGGVDDEASSVSRRVNAMTVLARRMVDVSQSATDEQIREEIRSHVRARLERLVAVLGRGAMVRAGAE